MSRLHIYIILSCCIAFFADRVAARNLFPADSGVINVKDYGAKGDGVSDDTEAILKAIKDIPAMKHEWPWNSRIIYFPKGVYIVSDTIRHISPLGLFLPNLVIVGEYSRDTIIKLSDNAPLFSNPEAPRAIIQMASGLISSDPREGGRDYLKRGEGNDAYGNSIESLTIDIGVGNPGAIAVDYLANNQGCIRGVILTTKTPGGAAILMTRKWIGPALLQDVVISGPFSVGIEIANTEYSLTIDSLDIVGTTKYGMVNHDNVVAFNGLKIETAAGVGIANTGEMGLIVGRGGMIRGRGDRAIINAGFLNLDEFLIDQLEYAEKAEFDINKDHGGVYHEKTFLERPQWRVPVEHGPLTDDVLDEEAVNVASFGAVPDRGGDSTLAFQAAFNSGARKIYIPSGRYSVSAPLVIADSVELVEGLYSTIEAHFPLPSNSNSLGPLIREAPRSKALKIRRLNVSLDANVKTAIYHDQPNILILQDLVAFGPSALQRELAGGKVFGENLVFSSIQAYGSAGLWFRQLNTEGVGIRIFNSGSLLFITGLKTEQECIVLHNEHESKADVVGGLIYLVFRNTKDLAIFENNNASLSLSYAEEAFHENTSYKTHVVSISPDLIVRDRDLPRRGNFSRIVPNISVMVKSD